MIKDFALVIRIANCEDKDGKSGDCGKVGRLGLEKCDWSKMVWLRAEIGEAGDS